MAKGVRRVPGVSSWDRDFREPGHLPWAEIESKLGREFAVAHRAEIFEAREEYFFALSGFEQGAPLSHVNELRDRLRSLCGELHHIEILVNDGQSNADAADRLAKSILGKNAVSGDIETAFHGLAWLYGGDLRNKFSSLAAECHEVRTTLVKPDDFATVTGAGIPKVMAFKNLYEVLAKAAPGWGITPTENSKYFIHLVMWMIEETDFLKIQNKIKNARKNQKIRIAAKDK